MAGILQSLAGTLAKGVPGVATIGTATDVGTSRAYNDGAATVTFSTGAGPTPTIYYLTSTPSVSVWAGYSSPLTATGLASGTSYTFTVSAANDAGIGPSSGASNSITATTTPYYVGVSGYAATAGVSSTSNPTFTFSFTGTATGGKIITSYQYTTDGGTNWATTTGTLATQSNGSAFVAGSTPTGSIRAVNANGAGISNAVFSGVTAVKLPGAPTSLSVTNNSVAFGGTPTANVSFTAASNGGSTITSYQYSTNGGSTWITFAGTTSPQAMSTQSTGSNFVAGTTYTVLVRAISSYGTSDVTGSAGYTASTVPQAPTIGTLSAVTGAPYGSSPSLSISFTAGATGGDPTIYYQYSTNGGSNWINTSGTTSPQSITTQSTGSAFVAGSSYSVILRALNYSVGASNASSASNSATAITVPATMSAPTVTNVGTSRPYNNGAASVAFTAPATGGSAITLYEVTSTPAGGLGGGTGSPITVTGLQSNTAYTFKITARNIAGTGGASSASSPQTIVTTVPQAPTIGTATTGNASATVAYTAGANGGSTVTTYTATSSPGGLTGTGSSPITVSGLTNGTAYTFTVTATNANGTSSASSASNSVTPVVPAVAPSAPTNVTASDNLTPTGGTFSWTASATGTTPISYYYEIIAYLVGPVASGSTTSTSVQYTNAGYYSINVYASNSAGTASPVSPAQFTTFTAIPSAPTSLVNTYTAGPSWTGSWTASATGTTPITYYWTLYQSATNGGSVTATATGNTTSTSFTKAMTSANGLWAYYTVYASNSKGTSTTVTSAWA